MENPPAPFDSEKDAVTATRRRELRYLKDFAVSVFSPDLGLKGNTSRLAKSEDAVNLTNSDSFVMSVSVTALLSYSPRLSHHDLSNAGGGIPSGYSRRAMR